MYYTANTAFMNYFDNLIEQSETEKMDMHIFKNWTSEQKVFPIALQTSEFDTKLLQAPKTLKDLVRQHKQKGQLLDKSKNGKNRKSYFNNIIMDILSLYSNYSFNVSHSSNHSSCM